MCHGSHVEVSGWLARIILLSYHVASWTQVLRPGLDVSCPRSHLTSTALPLTTHNKARLERSFHAGLCSLVWLFMCWGLSGTLHALVSYPLVSHKVLSPWLVLFSHSKLRLQLSVSCPIEDFWIYDTSFCLFCQWWLIWIWQAGWLLSWEQPLLRHMLQSPMACSGATRVVQEVQGLQLIESMRNW